MSVFRRDRVHRGAWVVADLPEGTTVGDALEVRRENGSRACVVVTALVTGDDGSTVALIDEFPSVESILAAAARSGVR